MSENDEIKPTAEPSSTGESGEVTSDQQNTSGNSSVSDTVNAAVPPSAPPSSTSLPTPDSSSTLSVLAEKKKVVAIAAVVILILGYLVFGRGSGESTSSDVEYLAFDTSDEVFLASLEKDQVVTSTRLGDSLDSFTYLESLSSIETEQLLLISKGKSYFVWNDDEISELDRKNLTTSSLYRGESIDRVYYIADKNLFIINDNSNCFYLRDGKPATRVGAGLCSIMNHRVFTLDSSSSSIDVNEVDLEGKSLNRFSLEITNSVKIHESGNLISGQTTDGIFEVYSTADGQRVYSSQAGEVVTVLDEASNSSSFLLAVDNPDDDNETLDIGVLTVVDGSGAFKKLAAAYSVSGWLSPDASSALVLSSSEATSESKDLNLWTISDASSQPISQGIDSVLKDAEDSQGRVAILTNREFIVGSFDTTFSSRSSASFENGDVYFHKDGVVAQLQVNGKYDLIFVENGPADDSGNKTITLATSIESVSLADSSFSVPGYIYYLESSDNYSDLYRQKLAKDSERERVAEGRINQFALLPNGRLFYYERDDDRITSFIQKNEKPENRVQVSDRYVYFPSQTKPNPMSISRGIASYASASAAIDEDLKTCRSNDYQFVNTGSSIELTLTREYNSYESTSDYSYFCVRNASKVSITSSARADGDTTKYVGISCNDYEGAGASDSGDHATRDVFVELSKGVLVCGVYDANYYYTSFFDSTEPTRGMTVTVSVE